jgi:hypothetical protein
LSGRIARGKLPLPVIFSGHRTYHITPAPYPLIPEWGENVEIDEDFRKAVIEDNTMICTASHCWIKMVVEGNITTITFSDGNQSKTVVDGNTTITTYSDGRCVKWVEEGATTTITFSDGDKTVMDKRGYDIFIHRERGKPKWNEET